MKVLLLGAGNSIHLQRWANALAQAGAQLHVGTLQDPLSGGWNPAVQLHQLRPGTTHLGVTAYALAVPPLKRLLAAQPFDIVHAHYATGYGLLAHWARCRPRLVSVWGSDIDEFPQKSPLHAALLRRVLARADGLAATSQHLVRQVQTLLRDPAAAVAVTPFGVDTDQFAPPPQQALAAGPLVIGSSKGMAPVYGIDVLLRAFALMPERSDVGRPLRLRLLAVGPQQRDYERLSRALKLQDRVEFSGGVEHAQMPTELGRMNIFVAPSRQESFGVSVLEASACGLPVVVSAVGGLPEVLLPDATGLLVPPEQPQALADALLQLVNDPAKCRAMGQAGRLFVQQHYGWPACVQTMLATYAQLLGRAPAVAADAGAA